MQTMRMILFLTLFTSTPTLAQSVSVIHKMESDTIIVSQDDDVSIRVHRLPSSEIQIHNNSFFHDEKDANQKVALVIHKISEN